LLLDFFLIFNALNSACNSSILASLILIPSAVKKSATAAPAALAASDTISRISIGSGGFSLLSFLFFAPVDVFKFTILSSLKSLKLLYLYISYIILCFVVFKISFWIICHK
tara:strand:+ start:453 stop:785 length:333 start_codon:yes stop_codon:yes gene_type:complete